MEFANLSIQAEPCAGSLLQKTAILPNLLIWAIFGAIFIRIFIYSPSNFENKIKSRSHTFGGLLVS